MIKGFDFLGSASPHWDLDLTIRLCPRGIVWGGFDSGADNEEDNFGPSLVPVAEKVFKEGVTNLFRPQGSWNDHKLTSIRELRRIVPEWQSFAKRTGSKVWFSHSTEYRSKEKRVVEARVKVVRELGPDLIPVSNPSGGGYYVPGTVLEVHHGIVAGKGKGCSLDGQDIHEVNTPEWIRKNRRAGTIYLLGWGHELSMETEDTYGKIPHNKRTRMATRAELKEYFRLMGYK